MTSPFQTYQEFYEAEGAIYTFSHQPAIIGILLIVSALIFLYFIYFSFNVRKSESDTSGQAMLGVVLLAGALSLVDTVYTSYMNRNSDPARNQPTADMVQEESLAHRATDGFKPLAMLGLMSTGAAASSRRRLRVSRPTTSNRRRRLR
jgi:hypothetical protein